MTNARRLAAALVATALGVAAAGAARAVPAFTGLYVLGDSLADNGNANRAVDRFDDLIPGDWLGNPAPADQGYFDGRFSDGWNFADHLGLALLGAPPARTFPYGFRDPILNATIWSGRPEGNNLNFAYGGAQITQGSTPVPSLRKQVDAYARLPGDADPGALYVVTFGGNDIKDLVPIRDQPRAISAAVRAMREDAEVTRREIERLLDLGAANIVVTGTPDIGLLPHYAGEPGEAYRRMLATTYSRAFDQMVAQTLSSIALDAGARVDFISLFSLSREIASTPTAFGLTDTTRSCITTRPVSASPGCAGFLFFDGIHPTTAVHALLAERILARVAGSAAPPALAITVAQVPAPATLALFGLGVAALARRRG